VARTVLRQEVLEEDVAEDVENGLAAPSQGRCGHRGRTTPRRPSMTIQRMDNVLIVVDDLDAVITGAIKWSDANFAFVQVRRLTSHTPWLSP
jgi:hypothetical protein